jgi:uncharacterized DUF497 family protein
MAYTVAVRVTWDRAKNLANQKRHGVSFEEASELFRSGVDYLEQFDDDHSDLEDRFIAIGPIGAGWSWSSGPNVTATSCESSRRAGRPETSKHFSVFTSGG